MTSYAIRKDNVSQRNAAANKYSQSVSLSVVCACNTYVPTCVQTCRRRHSPTGLPPISLVVLFSEIITHTRSTCLKGIQPSRLKWIAMGPDYEYIHLGRVSIYPCFTLCLVSKRDEITYVHLSELSGKKTKKQTHLTAIFPGQPR